jgi:hypothetical protein
MTTRLVFVLPEQYTASEYMLKLHSFCEKNAIPVDMRCFDSITYSKDAKYIERLPAIHVIMNGRRVDTLHEGPTLLERVHTILRQTPVPLFTKIVSFLRSSKKVN